MKTWEVIKAIQEGSTKKYKKVEWGNGLFIEQKGIKIVDQGGYCYNDLVYCMSLNEEWEEVTEYPTKKDLKDGIIVEDCDGLRGIVIDDRILSLDGITYWWLDDLDNNLKLKGEQVIVKIVPLNEIPLYNKKGVRNQ